MKVVSLRLDGASLQLVEVSGPYRRRRALSVAASEAASRLPAPAGREASSVAFLLLQLFCHSFFPTICPNST